MGSLAPHLYLLSIIINGFRCAVGHDHREFPFGEHAGVAALAVANGQRVRTVVPMERDGGIDAVLVVVAVSLVLVEREVAVGTRIEPDLQIVPCLLTHILHLRTKGQNAAGTHEHRHSRERGLKRHMLSASIRFARPEVIPHGTLGQILGDALRLFPVDGSNSLGTVVR